MKAISYNVPTLESGKPEIELVNLPSPAAAPGEVLVRVHFVGLSNFDQENSGGNRNAAMSKALRKTAVISGIEMAGIVESDGTRFKKGDRVFAYTHIWKGPFFQAERVAVPEHNMALVPETCSMEGAASIVGGALTSINALERTAKLTSGDSVLITGASGSVGITGVQLAAHKGARISAVCHSSQTEFVLSQGATEVFAYDRHELPAPQNQFDLVFDTAPSLSFSTSRPYLKVRGRYISTMPHLDTIGALRSLFSRKKWGFLLEYDADEVRMERLRKLIEENAFSPAINSIYEATAAVEAFQRQHEPGKRGKILIDFRGLENRNPET